MTSLNYKFINTVIFIFFIFSIIFLNFLTPDRVFSESENRMLQQTPKFSLQRLLDGKFTNDFEKYISDQMPLRDVWIKIKAEAERMIGKRENNGVYLGSEGYLLQTFSKPEGESLQEKIKAINSFAVNSNSKIFLMLVPNSLKVLEDKLPPFATPADQLEYINLVKNNLADEVNFVDMFKTLSAKKKEYIFYRTDHHWTTRGAYYAYNKLAGDMGFIPHKEDYFTIQKITDDFYGSLYSKGSFRHLNPDSIELYIPKNNEKYRVHYYDNNQESNSLYELNNLEKKDKYTVFLNGNHSLIKIKTNNNSARKLLVIKDSFANSFIPFLTAHYSEIYMVDLRYFNDSISELIKEKGIEDVLILYSAINFFEDSSVTRIAW